MPRPTKISTSPPAAVEQALERLGRNIRMARLRRRLPQAGLAERMGVSRFVVADIERGKPTTGVAAYLGALWALGLLERAEAEAMFERIADTVRNGWHAEMRRAGTSERDCRMIAPAFLYDGLFHDNPG